MVMPFAPVLSGSLLVATASGLPGVDIQKTCRAAETAMIESFGRTTERSHFDACVTSEQNAREQLIKDWASYAAADRAQCIQPVIYMPSYVEWLTCLETARDVRKIQKDESLPSLPTPSPTGRSR